MSNSLNANFSDQPQNIKIKLSSFTASALDKSSADVVSALRKVGAMIVGPIPMPNASVSFSLNKSPHVNGKSKEKGKIVKHSRIIILLNATKVEIEAMSSINISSGVGVEIRVISKK